MFNRLRVTIRPAKWLVRKVRERGPKSRLRLESAWRRETGKWKKTNRKMKQNERDTRRPPAWQWGAGSAATGCTSSSSSKRSSKTRSPNTLAHQRQISSALLRMHVTHATDTEDGTRFPGLSLTFSQPPIDHFLSPRAGKTTLLHLS